MDASWELSGETRVKWTQLEDSVTTFLKVILFNVHGNSRAKKTLTVLKLVEQFGNRLELNFSWLYYTGYT